MVETQHDDAYEEDVEDLDEADEDIPYTYAITSYGADYPVDSLIKRLRSADIVVPTFDWSSKGGTDVVGFQREYVWPKPKADKFIESLLLGLPVPGIFLVKEATGRLLVLDGHQRLHTLRSYYEGIIRGKEYRLTNVQERFRDKLFRELDTEDRRRIDDSIIHATVIRQDEPTEDQSSIYIIFERLNTGGVNLQPQEIRVALYHGELVRVLKALNEEKAWRKLYGKKSGRLKDMEMILRFFAFYYHDHAYNRPMKDFLNKYMATNRDLERQPEAELQKVFHTTVTVLDDALGPSAFRPQRAVNAAVVDSLMVGIANRLKRGAIENLEFLQSRYKLLLSNENYIRAISTATADEANVETRLNLAKAAFAEVV
jgi:hypothetical protein